MKDAEKLKRIARLAEELVDEGNDLIITSRIEGLAKELDICKFHVALVYWAKKESGAFTKMYGPNTRIRLRAKK